MNWGRNRKDGVNRVHNGRSHMVNRYSYWPPLWICGVVCFFFYYIDSIDLSNVCIPTFEPYTKPRGITPGPTTASKWNWFWMEFLVPKAGKPRGHQGSVVSICPLNKTPELVSGKMCKKNIFHVKKVSCRFSLSPLTEAGGFKVYHKYVWRNHTCQNGSCQTWLFYGNDI